MKVSHKDTKQPERSTRSAKAGLPPGSLVYVGTNPGFSPYIEHYRYNLSGFEKEVITDPLSFSIGPATDDCQWVIVYGIHDPAVVEHVGKCYNLHHLLLEDVLNADQRPTAELYDDTFFASLKMVQWDDHLKTVKQEHVSVIFTHNTVILFQEKPGDIYDDVRMRIESGKGLIRSRKSDYLLYRLIDAVVDQYFVIGDHLNEKIERIEADILQHPDQRLMMRMITLKKQLLRLRNNAAPLRDHIALTERLDRTMLQKETVPYLRDLSAHVREVLEMIDLEREAVNSLIDLYMSASGQQLNNVMRVLTVIATIFIPLTFIVGIYGMNFTNMPEIEYRWGYATVWAVMVAVTIGLLIFFRRRGWV